MATQPTQYTLSINTVGSGSVAKNPNQTAYSPGIVVTLNATPIVGWQFDHWSGNLTGNTNPTTITMNGNKVVTATFTVIPQTYYTLTINKVGNGIVTPTSGLTTLLEQLSTSKHNPRVATGSKTGQETSAALLIKQPSP